MVRQRGTQDHTRKRASENEGKRDQADSQGTHGSGCWAAQGHHVNTRARCLDLEGMIAFRFNTGRAMGKLSLMTGREGPDFIGQVEFVGEKFVGKMQNAPQREPLAAVAFHSAIP